CRSGGWTGDNNMIMVVSAVTDETCRRRDVSLENDYLKKGSLKQIIGRLGSLRKRNAEALEKYESLLENFFNGG
ncbi:hypothetical protein A2U01_0017738, partial [Trifolium medium]|nr:hypothetical protein [Trifolium medium]